MLQKIQNKSSSAVPEQLTSLPSFVNWKRTPRGAKIPVQPNGEPAKTNDPDTWCRYSDLDHEKPIGVVLTEDDDIVMIDLDGCRDPETSELRPWAEAIIQQFDTYCEVSPSGTGVKLFGKS